MRSAMSSVGNIFKTTATVIGSYLIYDWMTTATMFDKENTKPVDSDSEDGANEECDKNFMLCPISNEKMTDPVMIKECGHTFERKNIEAKFDEGRQDDPFRLCPICEAKFSKIELCSNEAVLEVVQLDSI